MWQRGKYHQNKLPDEYIRKLDEVGLEFIYIVSESVVRPQLLVLLLVQLDWLCLEGTKKRAAHQPHVRCPRWIQEFGWIRHLVSVHFQ